MSAYPARHSDAAWKESWYLPPEIISRLAGGYENLLATLLWIDLTARFRPGDTDPAWVRFLARRLDAITRLNPKAEHAYYMAATILPWSAKSTRLSAPILDRAMQSMPDDWRWFFYRGFNAYWFDNDRDRAFALLAKSSRRPGAPPIVFRLAAKMRAQGKEIDTAIDFLRDLSTHLTDANLRAEAEKQLKLALTEKVLRQIEAEARCKRIALTDTDALHLLGLPENMTLPDGGHPIVIDGRLVSSKAKTRFRLFVPHHRAIQGRHSHD